MSLGTLAYLAGMLALYVAQRLLGGHDTLQTGTTVLALALVAAAAVSRWRGLKQASDEGLRLAHRVALMFLLVGCASLVVYLATTDGVVRGMRMGDEQESRWLGLWRSAWPLVWLLGTVPLLVVDYAVQSSPVMMPRRRVQDLARHGLVAAMGVALVFPINFIATKKNEKWDLGYFKTPTPGTATLALAQSLEQPVTVRIFMPPSSEVAGELRDYFALLEGPNLQVEIMDQAADPRLAKALSVRDNGTVTFTKGELDLDAAPDDAKADAKADEPKAPKPVTRTIKVNADFEKAKRTLKKLDSEVQQVLRELGHGERLAYLTTGHGELSWEGQVPMDRSAKDFKARLKQAGFKVKPLGLPEGLGQKVPDDADVVAVVGPLFPFTTAEVEALRTFVNAGGSLLVALEPVLARPPAPPGGTDPLDGLLAELGVRLGDGVLAAEGGFVAITNNKLDRFNIATNSFTSHGSTVTLAERANQMVLFTSGTGWLEEVEEHASKVTFTVRSLAVAWNDLDVDAEYDAEGGESKAARNLVAAISGGEGAAPWRALVTADSSIFSDLTQVEHPAFGNRQFIDDGVNWLIGAEALSGTTESEEDVKIEHTKEGQSTWFYMTVLGVPFGVLMLGALRLRLRRRGGAA